MWARTVVHGTDGSGAAPAEQQPRAILGAQAVALHQVLHHRGHDAAASELIAERGGTCAHVTAPQIRRAVPANEATLSAPAGHRHGYSGAHLTYTRLAVPHGLLPSVAKMPAEAKKWRSRACQHEQARRDIHNVGTRRPAQSRRTTAS